MPVHHHLRRKPIVRVSPKERRTRDGITFRSLAEARRYDELRLAERAGEVVMFLREPKFDLGGGVTYTADFLVFWSDGTTSVEDVKSKGGGHPEHVRRFRREKALTEARYPIEVEEVLR